jgi:hypothetical protein
MKNLLSRTSCVFIIDIVTKDVLSSSGAGSLKSIKHMFLLWPYNLHVAEVGPTQKIMEGTVSSVSNVILYNA